MHLVCLFVCDPKAELLLSLNAEGGLNLNSGDFELFLFFLGLSVLLPDLPDGVAFSFSKFEIKSDFSSKAFVWYFT